MSSSVGDPVRTDIEETGISYKRWIEMFMKHEILASKAKSTTANKARKTARENIAAELNVEFPNEGVTEERVRKAYNNKKSRLLAKTDSKRTGNVQVELSEDELKFFNFLIGPDGDNPSITSMPGAIATCSLTVPAQADPSNDHVEVQRAPAERERSNSAPPSPATVLGKRRPLPPPPSASSASSSSSFATKRMKYDRLYMELMEEQIKYYKNQNSKNDSILAFVEGLSNRMDFLESELNRLANFVCNGNPEPPIIASSLDEISFDSGN